ncbi:Ras-responsive element-binding protein 1, partial [Pseudolycoriella hygida]
MTVNLKKLSVTRETRDDSVESKQFVFVSYFEKRKTQFALAANMSKSGEILRFGQGNYSFLCIHCGFHFQDIQEILVHIDYHFDIQDQKAVNPELTDDLIGLNVQGLVYSDETEFKFEANSETKTDEPVEEQISISIGELIKTEKDLAAARESKKKRQIRKKRPEEKQTENAYADVRGHLCLLCDLHFQSSADYKKHLRTAHRKSTQLFQCFICQKFFKNIHLVKRHLGSELHSMNKGIKCYQCESEPTVNNEMEPRPHKCFLCPMPTFKELRHGLVWGKSYYSTVKDSETFMIFRRSTSSTLISITSSTTHLWGKENDCDTTIVPGPGICVPIIPDTKPFTKAPGIIALELDAL